MPLPDASRSRKPRRGLALVTVLLITTVFLILIGALMSNVVSELRLTGLHGDSNEAQRAAYAGIDDMVYQFELNDAGAAPGATPAPQNKTYTDDDGNTASYSVTVDTAQWQSQLPYYLIHATGNAGGAQRKVDALIEKQPFSAFNMFTISEFNNVGGAVFYASGEQFNGPVYSGGPMRVAYTVGQPPIFNDEVINAGTTNWVPGAPSNSADWAAVIANQANWHQVSSPLTLPTTNDNTQVEYAALVGNPSPSSPPSIPASAGLYINDKNVTGGGGGAITSGMFIAGPVTITSTGSSSANTETLTLNMSGVTETVNIDLNANTTTVKNSSGKVIASYTGVPIGEQAPGVVGSNGAIFATGAMTINAGSTFRGQYTLGVPDGLGLTNPTITMKGTVEYADTSLTSTDELAFWANDIVLTDNTNGNIEIDGAMFTGYYGECSTVCNDGTFKNSNCSVAPTCGGGTGVLTLRGSLIENVRGKRGTLGSSVTGFSTNGVYDPRLATRPPPFTPTTTQYVILALCTEDSTGTTCGQ